MYRCVSFEFRSDALKGMRSSCGPHACIFACVSVIVSAGAQDMGHYSTAITFGKSCQDV